MKKILLGKTGISVSKTAFGSLPIQRTTFDEAKTILIKAYENGINFFDTARGYSNSEEKIGLAFSDIRQKVIIATKTHTDNVDGFWKDLDESLKKLGTDYIDLYQFHNPSVLPRPEDGIGLYEAILKAKSMGKINHIGISSHKYEIAKQAIESGLYETLQYPLSYLSDEKDIELCSLCSEKNMGFIAMKALSGGMITNAKAAFLFFKNIDNAVPIWGIQRESELDEFINYSNNTPIMDDEIIKQMDKDKQELSGNFCRGCGYCLPCPANIPINTAARMSFILKRGVWQNFVSDEWQEKMSRIHDCIDCGECSRRCPYDIDTPNLLKIMLKDYEEFLLTHDA